MGKKPAHIALDVSIWVMVAGVTGCIAVTLWSILAPGFEGARWLATPALIATLAGVCATIIMEQFQEYDE